MFFFIYRVFPIFLAFELDEPRTQLLNEPPNELIVSDQKITFIYLLYIGEYHYNT